MKPTDPALQLAPDEVADLRTLFRCIDNTTLSGADTRATVRQLCADSLRMVDEQAGIGPVAAVCVYPVMVSTARQALEGSSIRVASVAGAFPSGQSPLHVKQAEVRYVLDEGADEVDMVLSRGALIEGSHQQVFDEVASIRELCQDRTLKVILETGELRQPALIAQASEIAIAAGADFIKTSTGKIAEGATPAAAAVMIEAIAQNIRKGGKTVGFKAAGGITDPLQALEYFRMCRPIMADKDFPYQTFRVGASRLTSRLFQLLTSTASHI